MHGLISDPPLALMDLSNHARRPKLRALDVRPFLQDGQRFLLLRDNLQVSGQMLLVPQLLGPALALCDGTLTIAEMQTTLALHYGMRFQDGTLRDMVRTLDEACFLENERFLQAQAQALDAYRRAPFRPPALAGQSYPADPAELRALLDAYLAEVGDVVPLPEARGLFSPHIDYPRGGAVYARAWKRAAAAAHAADLVVLIGTDHYSDTAASVTLTRQNYATPFGVLPTAAKIVDALAEAVGPQAAFAGELRHRGEHSLELVAVWLHHLREGRPVELAPVLTGSFSRFIEQGASPLDDPALAALAAALRESTAGRRVLWVASGDLAHVGPAFNGEPLAAEDKTRLAQADQGVIERLCAGDAEGFYAAIQRVGDQNNICGLSPGYLMLQALGAAEGECLAYRACPADEQDTSVVTVCGVVFE